MGFLAVSCLSVFTAVTVTTDDASTGLLMALALANFGFFLKDDD